MLLLSVEKGYETARNALRVYEIVCPGFISNTFTSGTSFCNSAGVSVTTVRNAREVNDPPGLAR